MRKTLLMAIAAIMCALSATASTGQSLGLNFIYGSKFDQVGIGADYRLNITKNIRINPELQYFFTSKHMKAWDANCNIHYVSTLFDDLKFYPIVGITYSHHTNSVKLPEDHNKKVVESWDRIGANLGAGLEYNFTDDVAVVFEVRGQLIKSFSQCVLNMGIRYKF